MLIVAIVAGAVAGVALTGWVRQRGASDMRSALEQAQTKVLELTAEAAALRATLAAERAGAAEKAALLEAAREQLANAFKALSAEALQTNNQQFLELAKGQFENLQLQSKHDLELRQQKIDDSLKPIRESLGKVDSQIQEIEKARVGAYQSLTQQVEQLMREQVLLRSETTNLVGALKQPGVRGRWGEIQLRRVVELAGMLAYCDFVEQQSVETEEGRLRPDLIVKLPGGRNVIVDSKVPLAGYLAALEARAAELRAHGLSAGIAPFDVTDETAARSAIDGVVRTHGALDILIANAGIHHARPLGEWKMDDWRRVMASNLDACFVLELVRLVDRERDAIDRIATALHHGVERLAQRVELADLDHQLVRRLIAGEARARIVRILIDRVEREVARLHVAIGNAGGFHGGDKRREVRVSGGNGHDGAGFLLFMVVRQSGGADAGQGEGEQGMLEYVHGISFCGSWEVCFGTTPLCRCMRAERVRFA